MDDFQKNQPPIKRHPALVSFSKDHHFGLLLAWKIRQGLMYAVAPERISNYVLFFFKEDLLMHFKEEEQFLFTMLPAGDPMRERAEADHSGIYQQIAQLEQDKNNPGLLNQFAEDLDKHIRFEEREFFNHLQQNVDEATIETAASRMPNNSKEIESKWDDAFWERKK